MLNIEERHLAIVNTILAKYDYSFFAFGSRITHKVKKFSDFDLFYIENIPLPILINIKEEFEESNLPYKVDIVDYNECDPSFKKILHSNYVCIQSGSQKAENLILK